MQQKQLWAEHLRAAATFFVVLLHVSAMVLYDFDRSADWHVGNFINSASRFCVPVFLMLTGAFVIPKNYGFAISFKKWLLRILLPFLFYSSFYLIYHYLTTPEPDMIAIVGLGISYHFWYVYIITAIYLLLPFVSGRIIRQSKKNLMILLLCWLSIFVIKFFFDSQGIVGKAIYLTGYFGYAILGYYLVRYNTGIPAKTIITVFAVGFLITFGGTYLMSAKKAAFSGVFYQYLMPNVLLMALAAFLFTKRQKWTGSGMILLSSRHSYGIYLIHVLVLKVLADIGITSEAFPAYLFIPVATVLCFGLSVGIVYAISKIPFGRYISG